MKRMTETKAMELTVYFNTIMEANDIPLDDKLTYDLLSRGDTDGIFMLETEWDKYDLRQIQPQNMDELTACMALSHDTTMNPYIYTYLKILKVRPLSYPHFEEIEAVRDILKDSHGLLIYKEQKEAICEYLNHMDENEKIKHKTAIAVLTRKINQRKGTLANRTFFQKRALLCYKMAYIKANHPDIFYHFLKEKE